MPEEEGVLGRVWEKKEAGCEEVGRVWRTCGRYDQEDWRFISNTISLRQVPALWGWKTKDFMCNTDLCQNHKFRRQLCTKEFEGR